MTPRLIDLLGPLFLALGLLLLTGAALAQDPDPDLAALLDEAQDLPTLETVLVSHRGDLIAERGYRGNSADDPTNIKSASKVIVTTMIGIAIDKGLLEGPDQPIQDILSDAFPQDPDPRLADVTLGHLMSMQAGLEATSGANYGAWVASDNWVRTALDRPFVDTPGGDMIYSTGSTHLLSAILTEVGGQSTRDLARQWFAPIDGFSIAGWQQDPQGVYLGGNEMAMSPRSLLAFGEMIANGGVTAQGERIVSQDWIARSWQQRTTSRFGGHGYGYGWFLTEFAGHAVSYAWGYGGQMLYIVPDLDLTVVMTSDPNSPSGDNGYRDRLHDVMTAIIEIINAAP